MPEAALQLKLRKAVRQLGFFRLSKKELRSFVLCEQKLRFLCLLNNKGLYRFNCFRYKPYLVYWVFLLIIDTV